MPTLAADERERGPKRRRVFFPQDLRGTIDGRYRIIRPLETHGQGQVFEVFDNVKWRRIALKTWGTFDARGEFRLKKEFRSVRGIRHPNLVKLDLLGSDNALGVVYYTMEFVEGVDFLSHVRRRLPSSGAVCADLDRLRAALRQLVSGVHALHRHERLHRDLKPSNVLVTPEGRVVILDFGLVDQLNRTGNTLRTIALEGTVEYMAPEQVTEYHAMTPASDWYAVGVMIYEAVTGVLPIDGDSQIELLGRKQSITPKPMSTLVRDVPPQLDVLVSRLLQVDPRKRATPAQLLAWCFDEPAHVLDAMSTRDPRSSAEGVALIGRGEQALALREAFSRLGDREQSLVFVRGAAGSGKSAFVRRLLDEFEAHPDVVVLSARCYQNETVQYNAFDSMTEVLARFLNNLDEAELRALVPEPLTRLAQVFPVFDRVSGLTAGDNHESTPDFQELRRQAFLELKHLLYDLATRYRLVMFMDDLQWGDSDSALLLQELITSPYRPPMLLIGCYRGDAPESPMLRELTRLRARFDRSTRGAHLVLGPLLPEEATRVARSLLRDLGIDDRERAAAIARESAGNIALIRRLVDNARIHPSAARDTPCPSSLAEAVQDCLARLSARARQAFELVALAEAPVPHDVLAEAVSAEADSLAMIGELRDANLIEERGGDDGPVLRCLDTRLREVAVEALSEEQRRRGHEALARAFVKLQRGDVEVWARHLVAAGSRAEALEYATSAAYEAATAFAFDHAAQLYRLALCCEPGSTRLRERLADALVHAGRCGEAGVHLLEIADAKCGKQRVELLARGIEQLLISGDRERGYAALRVLLDELGVEFPTTRTRTLRLYESRMQLIRSNTLHFREQSPFEVSGELRTRVDACWAVGKGLLLIDPLCGGYLIAESTLQALLAGEPRRIVRGLLVLGMLINNRDRDAGARILGYAEQLAMKINDRYAIGFAAINTGLASRSDGQWLEAASLLEFGINHLREHERGVTWEIGYAYTGLLSAYEALGELASIEGLVPNIMRQASAAGDVHTELLASLYQGLLSLAQDRIMDAEQTFLSALRRWRRLDSTLACMHLVKLSVYCDLYRGLPEKAWARVSGQVTRVTETQRQFLSFRVGRNDWHLLRGRAALAHAAALGGVTPTLRAEIERDIAALRTEPFDHAHAAVALLEAGLANLRGASQEVRAQLEIAEQRARCAGMTLLVACVRRRLGEHLGGEEGRRMIETADQHFAQRGVANPGRWALIFTPALSPRSTAEGEPAGWAA